MYAHSCVASLHCLPYFSWQLPTNYLTASPPPSTSILRSLKLKPAVPIPQYTHHIVIVVLVVDDHTTHTCGHTYIHIQTVKLLFTLHFETIATDFDIIGKVI